MINIRRMWQPLTATPFLATAAHHEILPCESLQRWIRCFWGGIAGAGASPTRIIPDACADLIYHIDETAGRIIQASFCGVSDVCGTAHLPMIPGHTVSTFAIRFHAFGAYAFADDALRGTLNGFESPEIRFGRLDRALRARLLELDGLPSRAAYAQSVLLAFQCRENPLVETAADVLLCHRGTATVSEWAHELFISSRQLERLLGEYWGLSPKKGSALVRYQALYQEICRGTVTDVQDAVARYGFADQAHLCREFRRYHGENVSHFFKTSCENGRTMEKNGVYPPEEVSTCAKASASAARTAARVHSLGDCAGAATNVRGVCSMRRRAARARFTPVCGRKRAC